MMYSPSARLAELVSMHLDDFFEAVEKEHVQVRMWVGQGANAGGPNWLLKSIGDRWNEGRVGRGRLVYVVTLRYYSPPRPLSTPASQVGLWQGDLHLQNLRLRSDAITRLWPQAPIAMHTGSVGSIHVKVGP